MKSYQAFFAELKRRKVFRVAAVYGVVAFGLIQVADPLTTALLLPDTFLTYVAAILLLGFPFALVLAWAFEVTPDGVQKTDDAAPGEIERILAEPASKRWPAGLGALLGLVALIAGAWWVGTRTGPGASSGADEARAGAEGDAPSARLAFADLSDDPRPSIAVLPFVNMSDEAQQEYFSDGITEEILNVLAKLDELRVAARTSAFAFRGQNLDMRAIGDSLDVGYLLEGSVRKAGDELRITAQLIDAATGSHLWSESYDRTLDDVFAIQSEIAEAIAEELRVPLGLEGDESLVTPTADLEAYDLYLAGRARMRERGESLLEARELFQAAIARDSSWAPAWAALAEVAELRIWHEAARPDDMPRSEFNRIAIEEAERAARRALDLDPNNASALVALGSVHRNRGEWDESHAMYLRALEIDPDNPEAHQQYGDLLLNLGRIAEGVKAMDRAAVLDPVQIRLEMLAFGLMLDDRWDEAIEARERALALSRTESERRRGMLALGRAYKDVGRWTDAADVYIQRNETFTDREPALGPRDVVRAYFDALAAADTALLPPESLDGIGPHSWLILGVPDSAVATRMRFYGTQPSGRMIEFWSPRFDSLRQHPPFANVLTAQGLGFEPQRTPPDQRTRPRALGLAAP